MADQWDDLLLNVTAKTLEVAKSAMVQTGQMVISATPVDTGMARNNWNTAIGNIDRSEQDADKSGKDALVRLEAKVRDLDLNQELLFTNSLPYAEALEFGHSQQAPTGMVRNAIARWPLTVAEVTRELKND